MLQANRKSFSPIRIPKQIKVTSFIAAQHVETPDDVRGCAHFMTASPAPYRAGLFSRRAQWDNIAITKAADLSRRNQATRPRPATLGGGDDHQSANSSHFFSMPEAALSLSAPLAADLTGA